ncbi:MAG: hypothetical protein EOO54_21930 [Haliea sp.]|nr:MAG: hypothetical protein EOO54_21930 [Haliea sp.]
MHIKIHYLLALALIAPAVHAQSTPAKKELVAKILKIQQPGIEGMARNLVEQPAAELMQRAGLALNARVAPEKREATAKEIQADVKKYMDDAGPLIQARATRLAPTTIGTLLEEKFTEDELKQVVAIIESPVYTKFQQLGGDMQKVLTEKLVAETRTVIEPKVRAMEVSIAKRLGLPTDEAAAGAAKPAPKAPARAASK